MKVLLYTLDVNAQLILWRCTIVVALIPPTALSSKELVGCGCCEPNNAFHIQAYNQASTIEVIVICIWTTHSSMH